MLFSLGDGSLHQVGVFQTSLHLVGDQNYGQRHIYFLIFEQSPLKADSGPVSAFDKIVIRRQSKEHDRQACQLITKAQTGQELAFNCEEV